MTTRSRPRRVRIEDQIRVVFPSRSDVLAEVLATLRRSGGGLLGHLVYDLPERSVGLFLCERPSEALPALRAGGLEPELESVVVVETENRWGAVSHLLKVLATEEVHVGYSYGTSATSELCVVIRTDDNETAAAELRRYLEAPEAIPPGST